ncbi:MAG TPA: hypothetical protein VGN52_19615 [Burkholderiales bacterium]|jgi:hypothetical protein
MSDATHSCLTALALKLRCGFFTEACDALPAMMETLAVHVSAQPAEQQQAFALHLDAALQDWERQDWLGLADTLEYDLAAQLGN